MTKRNRNTNRRITTPLLALGVTLGSWTQGHVLAQAPVESAGPNQNTPSLVVHPAKRSTGQDCEVNLVPRQGSQGFKLQVQIPETVQEIEVVPLSVGSPQRNFQIQIREVDRGQPDSPVSSVNAEEPVTGRMRDNSFFNTARDVAPRDFMTQRESEDDQVADSGFRVNPYFQSQKSAVQTSTARSQSPAVKRSPLMRQESVAAVAAPAPSIAEASIELPSVANPESSQPAAGAKKQTAAAQSRVVARPVSATSELNLRNMVSRTEYESSSTETVEEKQSTSDSAANMSVIKLETSGPATMQTGATADFRVTLRNTDDLPLQDLELRLSLPEGMHVTVLDRPAEYNGEQQTVTWVFPHLAGQSELALRYRVKAVDAGRLTQALEIGLNGQFDNLNTISTRSIR